MIPVLLNQTFCWRIQARLDGVALATESAFLASLLPDHNLTPAVPFRHPFASERQKIENFLHSPMGVRHITIEYSTPIVFLILKIEKRLGPIPTRSSSVPSSTHPLNRWEDRAI